MFWLTKNVAREARREPRVAALDALDAPAQRPAAEIDLWVLSVFQAHGPMTLSDLVTRVADRLYRDAVRDGAASVDIGLFGAKLFHAEAAAVVARGDGKWWAIDKGMQRVASIASTAAGAGRSLGIES
jgi:hypothetical protein